MQDLYTFSERNTIANAQARIEEIRRKVMRFQQIVSETKAEIARLKDSFVGHELEIINATNPRARFVNFTYNASLTISDLQLFVGAEQKIIDVAMSDIPCLEANIEQIHAQVKARQDVTLLARQAVIDKLQGELKTNGGLSDEQLKLLVELQAA